MTLFKKITLINFVQNYTSLNEKELKICIWNRPLERSHTVIEYTINFLHFYKL